MLLSREILSAVAGLGLTLLPGSPYRRPPSEGTSKAAMRATVQPNLKSNSVRGAAKAHLVVSYRKLPLSFEVNQGQTTKQVKFLTHGPGYTLFLTETEALLSLDTRKSGGQDLKEEHHKSPLPPRPWLGSAEKEHPDLVRMRLVGANPAAELSGMNELPGKVN